MLHGRNNLAARRRRTRLFLQGAIVFLAAVAMGIPTLRGGFVGGDDHRLALNHVLVNHPSFDHAVKLFTTFHRDLYQPLALLSFQAEFALTKVLGLYERGPQAFAWLFHLDNVLLHALNSLLVWFLVARLQCSTARRFSWFGKNRADDEAQPVGSAVRTIHDDPETGAAQGTIHDDLETRSARRTLQEAHPNEPSGAASAIATAAAMLFAIHPLQTEVVAWLNGRMFLMSTFFALATLLSFSAFLNRLDCTSRSPVHDDETRHRRYVVAFFAALTFLLLLCSALSKVRAGLPILLILVAVAHGAKLQWRVVGLWTACMLMTAVFLLINIQATSEADLFSLASEHLRGPRMVRILLALSCYFQHVIWPVGLSSYYPTPPIVHWTDPATWRAALIVVPAILFWGAASWRSRAARLGAIWFFAAIVDTLPIIPARNVLAADRYMYLPIVGLWWAGAVGGYRAYGACTAAWIRKIVLPIVATGICLVLVALCWHVASFYETPLKKTGRVARLFPEIPRVAERLGWSYYKAGDYATAINYAQRELLFDSPKVRSGAYQLMGMSELKRGRPDEALRLLHEALGIDPESPLAMYRLAMAYDELNRIEDALPFYEAAVAAAPSQNPTIHRLASVYRRLGRSRRARAMYDQALANNSYDVPAAMGLTELDLQLGTEEALKAAETRLLRLLEWMPENLNARVNLGAVFGAQGRQAKGVQTYLQVLRIDPNHATACLNLAQIHYAGGDPARAAPLFERALRGESVTPEVQTIVSEFRRVHTIYVALIEARYDEAVAGVETLCELEERGVQARARLLRAIERFDQQRPDNPWTFCLVARLMIAADRMDAARASIELCEKYCTEAPCLEYARTLRARLSALSDLRPDPSPPIVPRP